MKRTGKLTRTEIIQYFIDKNKAESYLEIGVQNGVNFNAIKCSLKIGVDPDPTSKATHLMTSDKFFQISGNTFDVIFIDGLHHEDQCTKDILNALERLNENGVIICHDMIPSSFEAQKVPRETKNWNGDVWKSFVKLRVRDDLEMRTVQTDCGCGIIRKAYPIGILHPDVIPQTYNELIKDQERFMNAITEEEFFQLY